MICLIHVCVLNMICVYNIFNIKYLCFLVKHLRVLGPAPLPGSYWTGESSNAASVNG